MIYVIRHKNKHKITFLSMALCIIGFSFNSAVYAQPYGKGTYGANVPYGSQTSLSIATGADVSIQITPDDNAVLGTGTNIVTITSTDVVGYSLYIRSLTSSDMTNGPAVLPASANAVPGVLSANTWGYNSNSSPTNFVGMTTSNVLVKSGAGPFTAGDPTTFTYGVSIDNNKPAGNYVTSVVYTAAPQTD